uniref:C-type lectin domain-containing protein n=1 Tax=Neogobius melanostomus TaxID=47308 RepID=A0A8C6S878_9GOBI
ETYAGWFRCVCVSAVCFSLCSEIPLWGYHFVDKNLTWSEAQQFCRQHYHDLACVSSSEDNLRLPRPPGYSAPVWIGLYDDPTDLSQWKWTATDSSGSFQNWESGEPRYIHEPHPALVTLVQTLGGAVAQQLD